MPCLNTDKVYEKCWLKTLYKERTRGVMKEEDSGGEQREVHE